jgi:hypothetical protein
MYNKIRIPYTVYRITREFLVTGATVIRHTLYVIRHSLRQSEIAQ